MAKYKVAKMLFTSPLHLGVGKTGEHTNSETIIHSDTLKSALFVCASKIYPELLEREAGEAFMNGFAISSAFPYFEDELFFPKPSIEGLFEVISDKEVKKEGKKDAKDKCKPSNSHEKKIKKISYVGYEIFKKILEGERNIGIKQEQYQANKKSTSYLFAKECKVFIKTATQQKVTVSRGGDEGYGDAEPYYIEQVFFGLDSEDKNRAKAGLFCLIELKNNKDIALEQKLKQALSLLGAEGVGMDRSSGNGMFEVDGEWGEIEFEAQENAESYLNLSLYCPTEAELKSFMNEENQCSYELVKRGGYITYFDGEHDYLTYRKKSIYMFKEGGLFASEGLAGKMVDLCPEAEFLNGKSPVWRDGRAIFVGIKKK